MRLIIWFIFMCGFLIFYYNKWSSPSQQQKLEVQEQYENNVRDENAIMPIWFRSRYKPWSDNMYYCLKLVWIHPLLSTILILGIVFYPIWAHLLNYLSKGRWSIPNEFLLLTVVVPLGFYIANFVLSSILYGVIYLILSLFTTSDSYVPWEFISYCLHAFVHLIGLALSVLLGSLALGKTIRNTRNNNSQKSIVSEKSHAVFVVGSMWKAFLVAIATSVGSQFGGWIGGVLIFVLASGFAAFLGFENSSSD